MATPAEWVAGARPRTLPAALAPVLAGTAIAVHVDAAVPWKAALALVVALALQVGVNYANDYSDGVRGTDDDRVGPMRLVGSGRATPGAVKRAAFLALGVAAVAGLVLAATTAWWLVAVGALSILAAWFYTGGSKPYGYLGLGEVMVFVFFGLVAVVGTTFVQTATDGSGTEGLLASVVVATAIGALACAILVANNLRDAPKDAVVGKRTLAVVLGETRTRTFFTALVELPAPALAVLALLTTPWVLLGLVYLVPGQKALRTVSGGATGPALIPVLGATGAAELLLGAGVLAGVLLDAAL